jgi:SAM-dependent methyltransferase
MQLGDETSYFIRPDYRINPKPVYCQRDAKEGTPQFDTYKIASEIGGNRVLDLGCGKGALLVAFFPQLTLGIDVGKNLKEAVKMFPDRSWQEMNLDEPHTLPTGFDLVICADVLEHLIHPEHLLKNLGRMVKAGSRVIISTPERELKRGPGNFGPPENLSHVREWNLFEFNRLLRHYEMPSDLMLVYSELKSRKRRTLLAVTPPL